MVDLAQDSLSDSWVMPGRSHSLGQMAISALMSDIPCRWIWAKSWQDHRHNEGTKISHTLPLGGMANASFTMSFICPSITQQALPDHILLLPDHQLDAEAKDKDNLIPRLEIT